MITPAGLSRAHRTIPGALQPLPACDANHSSIGEEGTELLFGDPSLLTLYMTKYPHRREARHILQSCCYGRLSVEQKPLFRGAQVLFTVNCCPCNNLLGSAVWRNRRG